MDKHTKKTPSLFRYPVLVAFGLFFIGLFVLDMATPDRAYSELENTTLTQRPRLTAVSADGLNNYFTSFTRYVKDQLFGRDQWISLQSVVETTLLQKEQNGGILLGKEHMMFPRTFGLLDSENRTLPKNTAAVEALCQRYPGKVDVLLAPAASVIYPEKVPANAPLLDEDAYLDQLSAAQIAAGVANGDFTAAEVARAALDAVEAREASSRETGNRLVRRLEDSKRIRDYVKAERETGVAAARQTADATRAQLETLRREYAELQRNPSANPANYTVRTSELSMQISDAADALRKAEEDIPRVTADLEHSLAAAKQAVEQAQDPIADAKRAHQAVTAEADAARDELQTAKTAAATRQRELREKIATQDKARREQEQAIANARADAAHAQSIIEQATEVHDHPEITESLAGS